MGSNPGAANRPTDGVRRSVELCVTAIQWMVYISPPFHTLSALDQDQQLKIMSHVSLESLTGALVPAVPSTDPFSSSIGPMILDRALKSYLHDSIHHTVSHKRIPRKPVAHMPRELFGRAKGHTIDLGSQQPYSTVPMSSSPPPT